MTDSRWPRQQARARDLAIQIHDRENLFTTASCSADSWRNVSDTYKIPTRDGIEMISSLATAYGVAGLFLNAWLSSFTFFANHRVSLVLSAPIVFAFIVSWRFYVAFAHGHTYGERFLLVGDQRDADTVRSALASQKSHFKMVGFLRLERTVEFANPLTVSDMGRSSLAFARVLGSAVEPVAGLRLGVESGEIVPTETATAERLCSVVLANKAQSVVVRNDAVSQPMSSALVRLRFQGIRIYSLADFYMKLSKELPLELLNDLWLPFAHGFGLLSSRMLRVVKRITDILLAIVGLLLAFPFFVLATILIKVESPGPIIFRQWRVGRMGKPFQLLKLRSMTMDAEGDGRARWAEVDDPRVTRVGRILRKLHLDELPQMINILRGEMSFVGPRPERREFVDQLAASIPYYQLRHFVPPGLSGWAQINYPYGASFQDSLRKLQFDLFYIRNASPLLDLKILVRTARVALFCEGSR